jgi:hypothetical protein
MCQRHVGMYVFARIYPCVCVYVCVNIQCYDKVHRVTNTESFTYLHETLGQFFCMYSSDLFDHFVTCAQEHAQRVGFSELLSQM